jgi:hypothetical protein
MAMLTIIAAITIMAKAAEMEGRSPEVWGIVTFLLCLLCSWIIPLPLINIVIGLVISFLALFATKVIEEKMS